jgi:ABC-2 type transport system ATP-binding protein
MSSHEVIIKVQNLVKNYGEFKAVKGIEFEVNYGEVFGPLDPNGTGKTTTLEMLVGLRKPDQGTAKIAQYDILSTI